jgi:hypothetical protein
MALLAGWALSWGRAGLRNAGSRDFRAAKALLGRAPPDGAPLSNEISESGQIEGHFFRCMQSCCCFKGILVPQGSRLVVPLLVPLAARSSALSNALNAFFSVLQSLCSCALSCWLSCSFRRNENGLSLTGSLMARGDEAIPL